MNRNEAKIILSRYRPGHTDSFDRDLSKAMELAQHDPVLREWFRKHCAEHSPGQKVSAGKATILSAPSKDSKTDSPLPWGKVARWTLIAAFLALAVPFLWSSFAPPPSNTFSSYRDRMARLVQRSYPMKTGTTNQNEIRQYFRANGGSTDFELPQHLETFPGHGAAVFTWHNQPVSLMGFETLDASNLFLFITDRSIFTDPPDPAQVHFEQVGKLMTVGWSTGRHVYLLTADSTEELKNCLQ